MDTNVSDSRREKSEERRWGDSPLRESVERDLDDAEKYDKEKVRDRGEHRSKEKRRSRREDKDHRSRDRDRSKTNDGLTDREKDVKDSEKEKVKEKKKEEKEEHGKDRTKDKAREKDPSREKSREKDHDRDRKDRERKRDRHRERDNEPESDRGQEKERGKDKAKEEREKDKGRDRVKGKDKGADKEKEKEQDKNKDRDMLDKEKDKDYSRKRVREEDHGEERSTDRDKLSRKSRDDHDNSRDGAKDYKAKGDRDHIRDRDTTNPGKASHEEDAVPIKGDYVIDSSAAQDQSAKEIQDRIMKMKEERLKRKPEGSDIISWVTKSRKLEESEKLKAKRRSKMLDEQDNVDDNDDDDGFTRTKGATDDLAGVKVLHGFDKVLEGGSVVLTLKDQEILADGELNENMDMLENVEIGEQKRRNDAYKAGKKAIYDDKFNDQLGEKKMLPQYDDPAEEEGVTLDVAGRFTADGNKKLEELRRKLQIPSNNNQVEDLNPTVRMSSDYYTPEEMLQFKKPKKKKSLRKREKLDLDALEAEARAEGLGASDLRSRNSSKSITTKEEEERAEAKRRSNAYQSAFAKAEEASRALRREQTLPTVKEEEDVEAFVDDAEDLQKSLARARKLALQKQAEKAPSGVEAIARLASASVSSESLDVQNSTSGDASENKVVFSEMDEFVWGLQLDNDSQRPNNEDVFMEEDEAPIASDENMDEAGGGADITDSGIDEPSRSEVKEDIVRDDIIHEAPVGKGLSGALKLFHERGTLKETIEWGGRNMDKKKSKVAGIHDDEGPKEIHLERRDEFGRILTPKEAFRLISHKFHGKGPGKTKQEKRMKQYQDEQKLKQMTSSDVLPQSVDRMREAQLQLKTPYLVLSGNVRPGQTSDPRSGFATVEREVPGSLTPMLGDEKVERFLGIKRFEAGSSSSKKQDPSKKKDPSKKQDPPEKP